MKLSLLLAFLVPMASLSPLDAVEPCRIEVVDADNGWPVPLVELRTTHEQRYVTDNAGVIALDAPELMGREVWFAVIGHGYGVEPDGFGHRGVRLTPKPGSTLRVEVQRRIVAKRLGRLTGAGRFAEAARFDPSRAAPESGVFGCDTIQLAEHRGKLFWSWGDTTMPHYPLGVFDMTAATTALRPLESFEPPLRLEFDYFTDDDHRPRAVCPMPGDGPTWAGGFVSLPDASGARRLVGSYVKIEPPLEAYESGLCIWDEDAERFERERVLWEKSDESPKRPPFPHGHPNRWTDEEGREWIIFGNPLPNFRCPATLEAWRDPETWEVLAPQPTIPAADRDREIEPHTGSIAWNAYRERWVTVFMENGGDPSFLGELWYAEADRPTGPWGPAVKILSHDNYTFYNPRVHPELTPGDSPILLFEGTYTKQFTDQFRPTPRHDYNQILYRLDLDDPALAPARE